MAELQIINGQTSDGYHTFDELYEHRITLWIALCRSQAKMHHRCDDVAWRSRLHSDGTSLPGWFVLGLGYDPGSQMTYHLPESKWEDCQFARELDRAPEWDGHTSAEVLQRIAQL